MSLLGLRQRSCSNIVKCSNRQQVLMTGDHQVIDSHSEENPTNQSFCGSGVNHGR